LKNSIVDSVDAVLLKAGIVNRGIC